VRDRRDRDRVIFERRERERERERVKLTMVKVRELGSRMVLGREGMHPACNGVLLLTRKKLT
jgi:hypothetical protein